LVTQEREVNLNIKNFQEFDHFVSAQATIYNQVLKELVAGCKCSRWMWFIFPQLSGLGHSVMSQKFAIESLEKKGTATI